MDRRDAFIVVGIALAAWSAMSLSYRNDQAEELEPIISDVPAIPSFESSADTFTAKVDRSTIVVVCDAQSLQVVRWMASEGAALIAKGWRIQTIDLEGSAEFRFYVFERGTWKIHNGHLSLATLTSLLSRTTPPQQHHKTGLPSVAGGMK